jgi:ribonuclease Z
MLDVALLGTGGMMPLPDRFLTSLLLRFNGNMLLIDCGEGTQVTLKRLGWGFKSISAICFTHYHADHISGLPGMLLTIGNSGRTEPLLLIGPTGLKNVYRGLSVIAPELPFEVRIIELDASQPNTIELNGLKITTQKAEHMITCLAYSVYVHRIGKFNVEKALSLGLPKQLWSVLQKEGEVVYGGNIYTSDMVLGDERKGLKLTYCTDSRPTRGICELAKDSDLFICEGMYGENEKLDKAKEHRHMIFAEAAKLARDSGSKELWLTHYSPALTDPAYFLNNARSIFPNTKAAHDRMTATLVFEEA